MQIRFSYDTKYGTFSDALYLDDDHGLTETEIEGIKQQRCQNWVAYIDSTQIASQNPDIIPDNPIEPTGE